MSTHLRQIRIEDSTGSYVAEVNAEGRLKVSAKHDDQDSEDISLFLAQELAGDLTLTANAVLDSFTIAVDSPTVAPVAGNYVFMKDGTRFSQVEIQSVSATGGTGYTLTLVMPNEYAFSTSSNVCLQNVNMAVDGSTTPIEFGLSPANMDASVEWDISRMIVSMTHSSAGDDGLFGNQTALAGGVYFRVYDGVTKNLFNAKRNADFANEGYDIAYPIRSGGGGTHGTRCRITFNGDDKRGVVKRLKATTSDKFAATVRDNLTGLTRCRVKLQGHVTD